MENNYQNNYYSKNNLWKWVLLYVLIGAIAYGLIYYFFFAKSGGYSYNAQQYQNNYERYKQTSNNSPFIKSDQDLISAYKNLDATDVNQLNTGLNQNDSDANTF